MWVGVSDHATSGPPLMPPRARFGGRSVKLGIHNLQRDVAGRPGLVEAFDDMSGGHADKPYPWVHERQSSVVTNLDRANCCSSMPIDGCAATTEDVAVNVAKIAYQKLARLLFADGVAFRWATAICHAVFIADSVASLGRPAFGFATRKSWRKQSIKPARWLRLAWYDKV